MKVVVADGHPTMRLGIKGLLLMTEVRVAGESGDGEEALRLVEELRPDLVILGLNLTGEIDGIEVCQRIKVLPNPPRVLILASHDCADDVSSCLFAGADGYLHKRARCEELLDAIRRTVAGERVWLPNDLIRERANAHLTSKGTRLTAKEREVVVLVLHRYSNARIAEKLHLSLPTVKTHVRNILRKYGLKSRWELFYLDVS